MQYGLRTLLGILVLGCAGLAMAGPWSYPPAPTSDAADVWFGKRYLDPYRPLENTKDKTVEAWFRAQAALSDRTLARIPGRDALISEWSAIDKRTPPSYRGVVVENGRTFYRKTVGGENVGKIYMRERWDGPERLLFDPASQGKGGDTVVTSFTPSWDGSRLMLTLTAKGSEWGALRVLRVADRTLLPDSISPVWGGGAWLPNGSGILYNGGNVIDVKSPEIELNRQLRLHKLGTPVASDRDLLSNVSTPELNIAAKELPDGAVLHAAPDRLVAFISTVQAEQRIYTAPLADLDKPRIEWKSLAQPSDGLVRGFAIDGRWMYAITHVGAPHYKIVRSPIDAPDWAHAETVVPEAADSIEGFERSKDALLVQYSNGIQGRAVRLDLASGRTADVTLPLTGAVTVSCPDGAGNRCLVAVTGWTQPVTRFDVDAVKGDVVKSVFNTDATYPEFADLVAEEVTVPGRDGTPIPLSIIHRKDLKLDGSTPCILEGYGAYGYSFTPGFNYTYSVAAVGVIMAIAHVRGGGEGGEAWYKAGYKTTKPNTWQDFIAAAEFLIAKGYTSPARLTGRGTSAGGILIGRAITERPDLFAAAVVNVGVANAMRAEFSPNGPVNAPEFGTVKDPIEAHALYEMDATQHVQPGVHYPGVLGVAGWNDPRVAVWQPGKFLAAVQQATRSGRPALLQINFDNGHFTEEKSVTFRNFANQYAFALWQAGHKAFQPSSGGGGKTEIQR